jgi:hypothetical protein
MSLFSTIPQSHPEPDMAHFLAAHDRWIADAGLSS